MKFGDECDLGKPGLDDGCAPNLVPPEDIAPPNAKFVVVVVVGAVDFTAPNEKFGWEGGAEVAAAPKVKFAVFVGAAVEAGAKGF